MVDEASSLEQVLGQLSATKAAARLLGCDLIRTVDGQQLIGRIVETEAYDQSDSSSHSFQGITNRNAVMFGPAGIAYVYFTYGMHYCINVVVGSKDAGSAVLIRALEPLAGQQIMATNRGTLEPTKLLSGPARLTQALKIDKEFNGHDLSQAPLILRLNPPLKGSQINWGARIGIREDQANIKAWRAVVSNSKYLSRPL